MSDVDRGREPEHLVLYDGECGFCQRTVRWILAADTSGRFRFAPLQGPTAAAIRARHPGLPGDPDTVLYVDRSREPERVFVRSEAVFRIADQLPRAPAWLDAVRRLPRWLTDVGYRLVARSRRLLSRMRADCPLPAPAERARFLP
jgi:predicted DCC family thiol-disulfide oxidoreductase YuxK